MARMASFLYRVQRQRNTPSPNADNSPSLFSIRLEGRHYTFQEVASCYHLLNTDSPTWGQTAWLPLSPVEVSFLSLQPVVAIVHGEPRSVCSYLVMETHFTDLLIFCSSSAIASRGSTSSLIMYFSIHWPCSGRSRKAEISQTDWWQMSHPMAVPCSKLLS